MNRYEKYKDSGVAWLGEVPAHWEMMSVKFALAIPITDGPHETPEILSDGIPFISAEAVKNDKLDFSKKRGYISEEDNLRFSKKYSPLKGDIYMVKSGATTGNVAKVETNEIFNIWSPLAVMRPNMDIILTNFLFYAIKSDYFNTSVKLKWNMGTQQNIGMGVLSNIRISIPPLAEQTAIANYLDNKLGEIDTLISKQETLLAKLAEQRTAIITSAVTKGLNPNTAMKESGVEWLGQVPVHWEVIKNKFVFEFSKGLTITKENLLDDGIPCVNYGEIHSKYGFEVNPKHHRLKCVSEEYLITSQSALLKIGDFVFADTSEDVKGSGNFTYLNANIPTFAGYHTIIARPNLNKALPRFLAYAIESNGHRNQIRAIVKGVKVFSITQALLKNTFIWLPPLDEQTAIADYLDKHTAQIDHLCNTINTTISRLKEYRNALISQAVTGKIKITEVNNV